MFYLIDWYSNKVSCECLLNYSGLWGFCLFFIVFCLLNFHSLKNSQSICLLKMFGNIKK